MKRFFVLIVIAVIMIASVLTVAGETKLSHIYDEVVVRDIWNGTHTSKLGTTYSVCYANQPTSTKTC